MKNFIHLGFPKNFSSSLQTQFFAKHPDILHLGSGIGEKNYGCINNHIETLLELHLKTAGHYTWERDKVKMREELNNTLSRERMPEHKVASISSEHLCFKYSNDCLDFETKIERLNYLFQDDISFIIIIRNQWDLLKSLWREYVRTGFHRSFAQFIEITFQLQDRNLFHDLNYSRTYRIIKEAFPESQIHFLTFESLRNTSGLVHSGKMPKILASLSSIMGISQLPLDFKNKNEALPESTIHALLQLNKHSRHNIGNTLIEAPEKHRLETWYNDFLRLQLPEAQIFEDVKIKRLLINTSSKSKENKNSYLYECNEELKRHISEYYVKANEEFRQELKIELPPVYFNFVQ